MTYTSNKILNNVSYSHKVDFLTTEKLAGFKMKSWQVFKQKVGRFYPKNRVPPLIQKFIAGLFLHVGVPSQSLTAIIKGAEKYTL